MSSALSECALDHRGIGFGHQGGLGYPVEEASPIAVRVVRAFAPHFEEIRFVLFGSPTYTAWLDATRAALSR